MNFLPAKATRCTCRAPNRRKPVHSAHLSKGRARIFYSERQGARAYLPSGIKRLSRAGRPPLIDYNFRESARLISEWRRASSRGARDVLRGVRPARDYARVIGFYCGGVSAAVIARLNYAGRYWRQLLTIQSVFIGGTVGEVGATHWRAISRRAVGFD